MAEQQTLQIKINDFEGPLDLLLHLIKETKMSIEDVPILTVVDHYLTFIKSMQVMQLDIAGDYLVMAATLLEIKSRVLLPRVDKVDIDADGYEEDENLEENLKQQLIEYKKFKDVAQVLQEKEEQRGQFFSKAPSDLHHLQEVIPLKENEVTLNDVILAFQRLFEKQAKAQPIQAKIEMAKWSVEDAMQKIWYELERFDNVDLATLVHSKTSLISTFLAVLEMAKTQQITFKQSTPYDPIVLIKGAAFKKRDTLTITSGL